MQIRRSVKKILPHTQTTFDQEFWSVLVAIGVLCGIAGGAVLTLLHGPWMWGSLLILPALAAAAVFALYRLDDSFLRRSLQLAVIASLAIHLAILILASMTNVFNNPYQVDKPEVAHRNSKTITVSNQQVPFVWQQTNRRNTPEPPVELEREQPTTSEPPQPIPVENQTRELSPQIVRRTEPAETVPRMDQQLSQLRRQTRQLHPRSAQQASSQMLATNQQSNQSPKASATEPIARQSAAASSAQKSDASPAQSTLPAKAVQRRTNPRDAQPTGAPSTATARIRRSAPKIPTLARSQPVEQPVHRESPTEPLLEPTQSAQRVARRPQLQPLPKLSQTNAQRVQRTPMNRLQQSAQRRSIASEQPTISKPEATSTEPRRAPRPTRIATSTARVESPSPPIQSNSVNPRQQRPKTLAVSRGESGTAGAGKSANLSQMTGGATSPAIRASDSASRRRTENRTLDNISLTTAQRSRTSRSVANAPTPQSSFKANTASLAKISGSRIPNRQTVSSSAATIDTSSRQQRGEVAAEKGQAPVDLGSTKIVAERVSQRRSGGGQPEISHSNEPAATTSASRTESDRQPTLIADTGTETAAPSRSNAAPNQSAELAPSRHSIVQSKSGGENARSSEPSSADIRGPQSNDGVSQLAEQLADSRRRSDADSDLDSGLEEEDDEEQTRRGNVRSNLAQAPVTSRRAELGMGDEENEQSSSMLANEDDAESTARGLSANAGSALIQRASDALPGSTLRRTASSMLMGAAASMPLVDLGRSRRSDIPGQSESSESESSPNESAARDRSRTNATPQVASQAPQIDFGQAGSMSNREVNPGEFSVERAEPMQGAALDIAAVEGPAGLADRPDTHLGVRARPASRESDLIQPEAATRFRRSEFGGNVAVNPDAVMSREAFRSRQPAALGNASPSTEAAIHLGLEFLARHQLADGRWSLSRFDTEHPLHKKQLESDTAATGLALLAFQGAGYNHREFKYARLMKHALDWLIANQDDEGNLYVPTNEYSDRSCLMYSHAIAALALTEAYGMTQDPTLREPAQRALDYIANTQDPNKGGWRYFADPRKRSTDTSVTGWMMMVLQSGRLAGLDVPQSTWDGIELWMEVARDPENESRFRYNPHAVDSDGVSRIHGRRASNSMTSVGLLMRIYSGWGYDDPRLISGADSLLTALPSDANQVARDTYYWYYATQVLKHVGGDRWKTWNDRLHPLLIRSQEKTGDLAGSWDPYDPVPDRWGMFAGRLYVTTMNLLSLEVRYRLLPIYAANR